ncbi:DNA helicase-like protein, putative [Medicago truncatula]|uniref:DNA helicase-like protein, putative n=1 Tax=Medicago truncatula TaxID=3880 RepID=G7LFH1_MEDTR|nr:DNA helicase-like protein, putative [Medicago truncatula]
MLLRNIDLRYGLCNGTRLLCRGFFKNMLDVEILTKSNAGKRAFFPRIKLKTNASSGLPFFHDQLYVALSKGISQNLTKVLIKEEKIEGEDGDFTKNVVLKIFFLS